MLHPRGDELNVLAAAKASSFHDVVPVQPALSPVQSGRSQWRVDGEGPCRNGWTLFMQDGISTALYPHGTASCPSLAECSVVRTLTKVCTALQRLESDSVDFLGKDGTSWMNVTAGTYTLTFLREHVAVRLVLRVLACRFCCAQETSMRAVH